MFKNFLIVALGGAIGTSIRYGSYLLVGPKSFPVSTLLINIIGSFIIGIVIGVGLKHNDFPNELKLFFAVGICGGFTTFSAFAIENLNLLQTGKYFLCAVYIIGSLLFGVAAAWLGYHLGLKS